MAAQSGLKVGDIVGKEQLQAAADRLVASGLFSKVNYSFKTDTEGIHVVFDLQDVPGTPVVFDNFPWFTDDELSGALRKATGFFDGTAPPDGPVLDAMSTAISNFLPSRGIHGLVQHSLIQWPDGTGSVMQFSLEGNPVYVQGIEFSDPLPSKSLQVNAQLSDIVGHPFSRLAVALYAFEEIRPVYFSSGYLKVSFGAPVTSFIPSATAGARDSVHVLLPIKLGPQYHFAGITWSGNTTYSVTALSTMLPIPTGAVADGNKLQAAWGAIAKSYGHIGYMDAQLDAQADFDDAAAKVSYRVQITEGAQYKMGDLVLTGLSLDGERKLRQAWQIASGAVFDESYFDDFVTKIEKPTPAVFGTVPVHYDKLGRLLRPNEKTHVVDVLFDFQ